MNTKISPTGPLTIVHNAAAVDFKALAPQLRAKDLKGLQGLLPRGDVAHGLKCLVGQSISSFIATDSTGIVFIGGFVFHGNSARFWVAGTDRVYQHFPRVALSLSAILHRAFEAYPKLQQIDTRCLSTNSMYRHFLRWTGATSYAGEPASPHGAPLVPWAFNRVDFITP